MICPPCKLGGNEVAAPLDPKEGAQARAKNLHLECEAPATCPCQHRTDSVRMRKSA